MIRSPTLKIGNRLFVFVSASVFGFCMNTYEKDTTTWNHKQERKTETEGKDWALRPKINQTFWSEIQDLSACAGQHTGPKRLFPRTMGGLELEFDYISSVFGNRKIDCSLFVKSFVTQHQCIKLVITIKTSYGCSDCARNYRPYLFAGGQPNHLTTRL